MLNDSRTTIKLYTVEKSDVFLLAMVRINTFAASCMKILNGLPTDRVALAVNVHRRRLDAHLITFASFSSGLGDGTPV